jgi:uncharacterized membrane protein YgcG
MRRAIVVLSAAATVGLAVLGPAALAAALPPASVRAGVDDFTFDLFDADYYLDIDADGRSTLTTVETLVADFPEFDQNHGILRALPAEYREAPTDLQVTSVTDGAGAPREFDVETEDGFVEVTIAAEDFVHGQQTYVITYTQRNVTRYFANTDDDELYWDTNGTGWAQPFGSVSARFHIPASLAAELTGENTCYRGFEGFSDPCDLSVESTADETIVSFAEDDVGPYQNVTVAIAFAPHTFVPRDDSYFASPLAFLQLLCLLVSVIVAIWAIVLRTTAFANGRGRPTVIAEYTPPAGLDLFTAAVVLRRTNRAAASAFVQLAVTRRIRIIEQEPTGWFSRTPSYLLELIDPTGLDSYELALAHSLFPGLQPGTGYLIRAKDTAMSEKVRAIVASATAGAVLHGLRKRGMARRAVLPTVLAIAAAVGAIVTGAFLLENAFGGTLPLILFFPPIVAMIVVFACVFRSPLSDAGAELRDHLRGLELYIRLAEADRLRMLQSPAGAEREAVSATDQRQVIDIYEKLLPYAVLFGLEQRWAAELSKYYTEQSPDWYSGQGAFNAAIFASNIGSMSATAASSYSGSSTSSASGGSGGGGSSGGGGGGGGGGGV